MSRTQFVVLALTMPFWLGMMMVLWAKNPLFILVPCGVLSLGGLGLIISFIFAADLRTGDDWDLLIRSVLHRLGFNVQPPKSLMDDMELGIHDHPHDHSHPEHHTEKDHAS